MIYSSIEAVELELQYLNELRERLRKVLHQTKQYENTYLNVDKRENESYYHMVVERNGKRIRKYVGKSGTTTVRLLHRRVYEKNALRICEKDIKILSAVVEKYQRLDPEIILKSAGKAYQEASGEAYALFGIAEQNSWIEREKRIKETDGDYKAENLNHFSADGKGKRSKGEVIIANILIDLKACYIYEPVRYIRGRKYHPDFVVYNEKNGNEIVIEYMGMMYRSDYRADAFRRIENYLLDGYTLGKNLLVFMDNEDGNIDSYRIKRILEAALT